MELYGSLVANEGSGGGGGGTADVPIKSVSVNGTGVVPVNKNVNIEVPTKTSDLKNDSNFASTDDIPTKTSELENDSNFASTGDIPTKLSQLEDDSTFVTESDLQAKDYASKTYVGEQIADADHLKRKIVDALPEASEADEHTIYMIKDDTVAGNDKYKEYMLIEGVVQCVGDTSVDLTDYAKTSEVPTTVEELTDSDDYAKKTDIPTTVAELTDADEYAKVSDVDSEMLDIKMLGWTVPKDFPVKNYIDENGVFHQKVDRVDMGDLDWGYYNESSHERFYCNLSDIAKPLTNNSIGNLMCSIYTTTNANDTYLHRADNTLSVDVNRNVCIYDSEYTTTDTFKSSLKGVYLYYELNSEKTVAVDGNELVTCIKDIVYDYEAISSGDADTICPRHSMLSVGVSNADASSGAIQNLPTTLGGLLITNTYGNVHQFYLDSSNGVYKRYGWYKTTDTISWMPWKKICMTSVEESDVVDFSNELPTVLGTELTYVTAVCRKKNGVAFVTISFDFTAGSIANTTVINGLNTLGLPKPLDLVNVVGGYGDTFGGVMHFQADGSIVTRLNQSATRFKASFSYIYE